MKKIFVTTEHYHPLTHTHKLSLSICKFKNKTDYLSEAIVKKQQYYWLIKANKQFQNYDGVIVRSDTKITSDILASGANGRLKVVGRAGVGVDNIDVEAASKNRVVVLK